MEKSVMARPELQFKEPTAPLSHAQSQQGCKEAFQEAKSRASLAPKNLSSYSSIYKTHGNFQYLQLPLAASPHWTVSTGTSFSVLDPDGTRFLGQGPVSCGNRQCLSTFAPQGRWQLLPGQEPFVTQEVKPQNHLQKAGPCLSPAWLPAQLNSSVPALHPGLLSVLNTCL